VLDRAFWHQCGKTMLLHLCDSTRNVGDTSLGTNGRVVVGVGGCILMIMIIVGLVATLSIPLGLVLDHLAIYMCLLLGLDGSNSFA